MEFLLYPLALIVTLGVLVTFHELGHFVIARLSGVHVVRFSVGFGKPFWSRFDKHGTEFAVAAIPLGGYVRMLDEREFGGEYVTGGAAEGEPLTAPEGSVAYGELNVWWRIAIAFGGPLANFLLALVVYWFLFVVGSTAYAPVLGPVGEDTAAARAGLPPYEEVVAVDGAPTRNWQEINMALAGRLGDTGEIAVATRRPGASDSRTWNIPISEWHTGVDEPDLIGSLGIQPVIPAVLAQVLEDSAAMRAGLRQWDRVAAVDGEAIESWQEWVNVIQGAPGRTLDVLVDRGGQQIEVRVVPDARDNTDGTQSGYLGVGLFTNEIRYGVLEAIPQSAKETVDKTVLTLSLLKKMIVGQVSVKNLSGPIYIAKIAGDSARSGWRIYVGVLALLSISLGVINLLPIPILDGGHIVFGFAEVVTRRPVSLRVQALATQVGLFVFVGIFLLVIYNDLSRLL